MSSAYVGARGVRPARYAPSPRSRRTSNISSQLSILAEKSKLLLFIEQYSTSNIASMISTTTKAAPVTLKAVENQRMRVDGTDAQFGDWRDDLARDGYAVIKGAIPRERADKYADQMYSWLEGLSVLT